MPIAFLTETTAGLSSFAAIGQAITDAFGVLTDQISSVVSAIGSTPVLLFTFILGMAGVGISIFRRLLNLGM